MKLSARLAWSVVRHIATAAGGFLVKAGLATQSEVSIIAGGAVAAYGLIHSLVDKWKVHKAAAVGIMGLMGMMGLMSGCKSTTFRHTTTEFVPVGTNLVQVVKTVQVTDRRCLLQTAAKISGQADTNGAWTISVDAQSNPQTQMITDAISAAVTAATKSAAAAAKP